MALVELGAKLDFLRRHRRVGRQLGRTLIRQAVEDPFFATMQRWHAAGQQRAARRLARVYLRHWPGRLRGWRLALGCHLPWRVYARLVTQPNPTGGPAGAITPTRSPQA